MQRRKPPAGKPVVYAWWDYCGPCGHVQHYPEALVKGEREAAPAAPVRARRPRVSAGYAIVGELYDPTQDDGSLPW